MELYIRYLNRAKEEFERLNDTELDDLEMDEDEKYNRKLESGLYSLQVNLFLKVNPKRLIKVLSTGLLSGLIWELLQSEENLQVLEEKESCK
ncbi:hypothetical protein L1987_65244 [Smallanthus sonchifolius]|uniref:Uncharacterized protein n=1 Tax=Smallanthus sonchifolius TaxID=185202 RepID=A0ACB9BTX4_9ASTR|nr:hypothetical protein L1987_65244 [Smallanthus sonchifolius]